MSKIIRGQSTFLTFLHCCSNNSIKIFVANYRSNFRPPPHPLPPPPPYSIHSRIRSFEREKKRAFFIQYRIIARFDIFLSQNLIPCENGEKKKAFKESKISTLRFNIATLKFDRNSGKRRERRNDFSFSNLPWKIDFHRKLRIPLTN